MFFGLQTENLQIFFALLSAKNLAILVAASSTVALRSGWNCTFDSCGIEIRRFRVATLGIAAKKQEAQLDEWLYDSRFGSFPVLLRPLQWKWQRLTDWKRRIIIINKPREKNVQMQVLTIRVVLQIQKWTVQPFVPITFCEEQTGHVYLRVSLLKW